MSNRLGCLSFGCCWGSESARGIVYWNREASIHVKRSHMAGKRLHPVQLYGSVLYLLSFLLVLALVRNGVLTISGDTFAVSMCLWAAARLVLERFRADFLGASVSTGSLALAQIVGSLLFFLYGREERRALEWNDEWQWMQCVDWWQLLFAFAFPFFAYGVK